MNTTGLVRTRHYKPWPWRLLYPRIPFKEGLAFAWGDTIYTADVKLPKSIIIHESVHLAQQRRSKFFGFFCLLLYKFVPWYRKRCEVQAYRHEKKYLTTLGLPTEGLAKKLSAELYGVMTLEEAEEALK